jgi:beta-fructofuranosidase
VGEVVTQATGLVAPGGEKEMTKGPSVMPSSTGLFRPSDGWMGDVLPVYIDGTFHLFHGFLSMHDRGAPGVPKGVDLGHVTTADFVTFVEQPMALHRGGLEDADLLIGAGSIVSGEDGYIMFYCGINPRRGSGGGATQVVLRATSPDLYSWAKDVAFVLEADSERYERNDWRDPSVIRDGDVWRMLVCTRVPKGPFDRRGAIGSAVSHDLVNWNVGDPVLFTGTTYAPECPQVVDFGGNCYLLYSTYSDRFATRYRLGGGSLEAWIRPTYDELDSHDVYAIKAVSDGTRLYALGWLSTRSGDRDAGYRQWGGDLVVHELVQRADRTLGAKLPDGLSAQFDRRPAPFEPRSGVWSLMDGHARFQGNGFGWCSVGTVDHRSIFEVTVDVISSAEEFGIAIRASADFGSAYLLRFEPTSQRVVFDRRPHRIDEPFDYRSDRAYVSAPDHEIDRPLIAGTTSARVRVMVEGSAIVAYVGDVALTTRGYDLAAGEFGVYAAHGAATFSNAVLGRPRRES